MHLVSFGLIAGPTPQEVREQAAKQVQLAQARALAAAAPSEAPHNVPRMNYAVQQQLQMAAKQQHMQNLGESVFHMYNHQYDRTVPDGSLPKLHDSLHMSHCDIPQQPQLQFDLEQAQAQLMQQGLAVEEAQAQAQSQLAQAQAQAHAQLAQTQAQVQAQVQAQQQAGSSGSKPQWELEGTTPEYRAYLTGRSQTRPQHPLTFSSEKTFAPDQAHMFDYHPFFRNFFSKAEPLVGLDGEGAAPGAFAPSIPAAQRPYDTGAKHPFWMLTPENPYAQVPGSHRSSAA